MPRDRRQDFSLFILQRSPRLFCKGLPPHKLTVSPEIHSLLWWLPIIQQPCFSHIHLVSHCAVTYPQPILPIIAFDVLVMLNHITLNQNGLWLTFSTSCSSKLLLLLRVCSSKVISTEENWHTNTTTTIGITSTELNNEKKVSFFFYSIYKIFCVIHSMHFKQLRKYKTVFF